jgi:hypothetical protein
VDRLFRAHLAARDLDRPVRDHLVGVHVGLRARTGLPHAERKMLVQLPFDHLVRGLHDEILLVFRQLAKVEIHDRRRLFQNAEGSYHLARHYIESDVEMFQ